MEKRGLDLVGIFHSHPAELNSYAVSGSMPSATDIVEAAYPAVQVIWTQRAGTWNAQGFWLDGAEVRTVQVLAPGGE
jgi:proteasome lid subunit RPN8/RPN11